MLLSSPTSHNGPFYELTKIATIKFSLYNFMHSTYYVCRLKALSGGLHSKQEVFHVTTNNIMTVRMFVCMCVLTDDNSLIT